MQPLRFGRYELLIRLASGGAANVFLVRDLLAPPPGRLLALKILQPSLAANEDFLNMFFTEARIAAQLRHAHVVSIAGFGQVEGIHCLAMEYVFGPSLAQLLRASAKERRPLTVGVLLKIAACVCDALHHAHELRDQDGHPLGLVHRDVTPQNILIGFNGVPKITDFGIAKATDRGWETRVGIVKGKFAYMSPEQAQGKLVDRRSDIFGAGIVLWEALTGRSLFRGTTPIEVLTAIREHEIEPPSKVVPGLTPVVDRIVMRALRRPTHLRYQTAAEMRDELDEVIRRAGVQLDAESISKELAAIYGADVGARRVALRQAMAGEADLEQLAQVLGGALLSRQHLPVIPGGFTNPDPLGLFSSDLLGAHEIEPSEAVLPARPEYSFVRTESAEGDFEIVESLYAEGEVQFESKPSAFERPEDSRTPVVAAWEENTPLASPQADEVEPLSEDEATIGSLPPKQAARFERDRRLALEDHGGSGFEEEKTFGALNFSAFGAPPTLTEDLSLGIGSSISTNASGAEARGLSPFPSSGASSLIARASSELDDEELRRALPRAPSLDMEHDSTPVPTSLVDTDLAAESALPLRITVEPSRGPVEPLESIVRVPALPGAEAVDEPAEPGSLTGLIELDGEALMVGESHEAEGNASHVSVSDDGFDGATPSPDNSESDSPRQADITQPNFVPPIEFEPTPTLACEKEVESVIAPPLPGTLQVMASQNSGASESEQAASSSCSVSPPSEVARESVPNVTRLSPVMLGLLMLTLLITGLVIGMLIGPRL